MASCNCILQIMFNDGFHLFFLQYLFIVMRRNLKQFIEDVLIWGMSLRDPPWATLESINARALCSYFFFGGGGGNPLPPHFEHW